MHYFVSARYLDIQHEARVRCMAIVLLHFEHILEVMKTGNSRFERSIYQNPIVLGRTTLKSTLNGFQKQTKHCKSQKHNRKGIGIAPNRPIELQIHHYEGFLQKRCRSQNPYSRSRDILSRVVRIYGFSYDFNAKPLILKANPLKVLPANF